MLEKYDIKLDIQINKPDKPDNLVMCDKLNDPNLWLLMF
jgi:hypothetical protein